MVFPAEFYLVLCESVWSGIYRKLWGTRATDRKQLLLFPTSPIRKKQLPDAEFLSRRFLLQEEVHPDPQGTNLMFAFFITSPISSSKLPARWVLASWRWARGEYRRALGVSRRRPR